MKTIRHTITLIMTLVISWSSFSQKAEQICYERNCKLQCECPISYKTNDASTLKHLKKQFYRNEAGHLYIKTGSVRPGKDGELVEKVYFSSSISQSIDVDTYIEFEDGTWYGKDKNSIYYTKGNSDGDHIWPIKDADVKTFKILNTISNFYATDINHIYKDDEILAGFKPSKTKFIRNKEGVITELVQGNLKYKIE